MRDSKSLLPANAKKIGAINIIIVGFVLSSFFGAIAVVGNPSDILLDRIESRHAEFGGADMYGYTFIDWETLMSLDPSIQDAYINTVTDALDFAFVHTQWNAVGNLDNETLDDYYLGNLTDYINALAVKGVQVVIHTWVSSYSPNWIKPLVPELYGQKDRWQGIDPETTNTTLLEHRNILKDSMVYYHKRLCDYFVANSLIDNIRGWCLDDETQSENWNDFFESITDVLLSYNASWKIGAMFNRYDKYHITGDAGMTCNYMDPYDQDPTFIQKITYAYQNSGVNNISVLISAMDPHDNIVFQQKMRRQAWIAWFMGAESIGCYTYLYGTDEWACVKGNGGAGPIITGKTLAAIESKIDIHKLNDAYAKIYGESDASVKQNLLNTLLRAYAEAKINHFDIARSLVQEVLAA